MDFPYATKTDLAQYLNVDEATLGPEVDAQLRNASYVIRQATLGKSDQDDLWSRFYFGAEDLTQEIKDATCAQIEYWRHIGEPMDVMGNPVINMGSVTINDKMPELAPRAYRILRPTGLLNRGISSVPSALRGGFRR